MGNADTKLHFRKAVVQLTTKTQPIDASDESFWEQFWGENVTNVQDFFALIPAAEIRALREEAPSNLATLCYKAVEKLVHASDVGCNTHQEQQIVLNCVRILTRIIPYIYEDPDWQGFFWSNLPAALEEGETKAVPLAISLLNALCDKHEDLQSIDSCEYIWEAGVGFAHSPPHVPSHDSNRTEILKLILTCFSQTMFQAPTDEAHSLPNRWIAAFTSVENRHALPLFTSLLNTVCGYDPVGYGLPYNHLLFSDCREPLVESALQILIVTLDQEISSGEGDEMVSASMQDNLFVNYLSRIHREEDFFFVLRGFTRLLNNPLHQTYLPHSTRKINFHQELLVFLWKFCDFNKKFLYYVLKSSDVLDILVPVLYHLNDARADQSRVGLMHIGVFILLLLSGERNFGVRLNKPYTASIPIDIPVFTGTHSDLLIIVFHKIITTGNQRLQPLFDCLLTILVNVSPYMKTMSMIAANKLLHLLEAFSTPWFLFSSPHHHHLVFFLLETFNNIIQYQFDGNSNLVYTIIRKRQVFHALANLPTDNGTINKSLYKRGAGGGKRQSVLRQPSAELAKLTPGHPADSTTSHGTQTASLATMPGLDIITEKESAHPTPKQLRELTKSNSLNGHDLVSIVSPTGDSPLPAIQQLQRDVSSHVSDDAVAEPLDISLDHMHINKDVDCTFNGGKVNEDSDDDVQLILEDNEGAKCAMTSSVSGLLSPSSTSGKSVTSCSGNVGVSVTSPSPSQDQPWAPSSTWVVSWKAKLPLQTIMRLLQVLVPQVEKICIDKGLKDESEILRFLQHGTLVGLLPVPHPILIRKYQANAGTATWFRTYMWGIIYLRNLDPPIWYDTDVKLFEIQRV